MWDKLYPSLPHGRDFSTEVKSIPCFGLYTLPQSFPEFGVRANHISFSKQLIRHANAQAPPQTSYIRASGDRDIMSVFSGHWGWLLHNQTCKVLLKHLLAQATGLHALSNLSILSEYFFLSTCRIITILQKSRRAVSMTETPTKQGDTDLGGKCQCQCLYSLNSPASQTGLACPQSRTKCCMPPTFPESFAGLVFVCAVCPVFWWKGSTWDLLLYKKTFTRCLLGSFISLWGKRGEWEEEYFLEPRNGVKT